MDNQDPKERAVHQVSLDVMVHLVPQAQLEKGESVANQVDQVLLVSVDRQDQQDRQDLVVKLERGDPVADLARMGLEAPLDLPGQMELVEKEDHKDLLDLQDKMDH